MFDVEDEIIDSFLENVSFILEDEDYKKILDIKKNKCKDFKALIKKAREEGFKSGFKLRFERGVENIRLKEEDKKMVLKLCKTGLPVKYILGSVNLTIEEVKEIVKEYKKNIKQVKE